ncbi:glutamate racemase [Candidatus Kaiserbacteria bacterium RIFCSPHIGHO2_02_FULL_54_11b]|uniref:Glutamate racemase n=2 Tax=Candidatus Kaiseribacteriota TaxID=1752734 RepID=A0A1F6CK07_9BACT|nr:MAG: glutamate racemase [Candidatus Kaiserbacteria bacterium RIFCSPHIGHO2_01_FULL_54_36b]OGG63841.1 MAG: glutamate racemase [Candidatus Kaiserbacteria bacterium RIFCSPHIGHO2_02_FULL_54_11b]
MVYPWLMIGFFDSGFGGLRVLRSVVSALPQYSYIYLGDSARAPYGSRSPEDVYRFTKQGVDFLFGQGVALVILACNTAASEALRKIQSDSDKKVLGVLIPFAEAAAARTKNKRIGVIATEGTVASGSYLREIQKVDPRIEVFQSACPLLVPLIEAGEHATTRVRELLREYLEPLLKEHIDTLVLGCTHYGILERELRAAVGSGVELISEHDVVPNSLVSYLSRHPEIEAKIDRSGKQRFFSTGDVDHFQKLGSVFFEKPIVAERAILSA